MPVQLQFSDNSLMTNFLGSNSLLGIQEESDSTSPGSNLDYSGIVEHTDSDDAGTQRRSFHRLHPDSPSTSAQSTAALSSENLITQKILDQLQVIGSNLDTLEKSNAKKTNDKTKVKSTARSIHRKSSGKCKQNSQARDQSSVTPMKASTRTTVPAYLPNLENLQQNALIQQSVEDRILELQQLNRTVMPSKLKSQRGDLVEALVKNREKWPHKYVLARNTKERITYDQLMMGQWMAGFCRHMREEQDQNCKDAILNYLIALLDDFFWVAAKACHVVLLCHMEQGEIKDYTHK